MQILLQALKDILTALAAFLSGELVQRQADVIKQEKAKADDTRKAFTQYEANRELSDSDLDKRLRDNGRL